MICPACPRDGPQARALIPFAPPATAATHAPPHSAPHNGPTRAADTEQTGKPLRSDGRPRKAPVTTAPPFVRRRGAINGAHGTVTSSRTRSFGMCQEASSGSASVRGLTAAAASGENFKEIERDASEDRLRVTECTFVDGNKPRDKCCGSLPAGIRNDCSRVPARLRSRPARASTGRAESCWPWVKENRGKIERGAHYEPKLRLSYKVRRSGGLRIILSHLRIKTRVQISLHGNFGTSSS